VTIFVAAAPELACISRQYWKDRVHDTSAIPAVWNDIVPSRAGISPRQPPIDGQRGQMASQSIRFVGDLEKFGSMQLG
jgi:hypothetical protein